MFKHEKHCSAMAFAKTGQRLSSTSCFDLNSPLSKLLQFTGYVFSFLFCVLHQHQIRSIIYCNKPLLKQSKTFHTMVSTVDTGGGRQSGNRQDLN